MISRLRSSTHCRSSNPRSVGPDSAARIRSTTSMTSWRRGTCSASIVASRRASRSRPRSAKTGCRSIVRAMSRIDAAGTSLSCGATKPQDVANPRSVGLLVDRIEVAGLADPRLAGHQEELAAASEHVVEPSVGELEQVVATDQERATNGTDRGIHRRRSVGRVRRRTSVERPMTGRSFEGRMSPASEPGRMAGNETEEAAMAKFMDVHSGFFGVTADQLKAAHEADLAIEKAEGVHFERAWLDPDAGQGLLPVDRPVARSGHADPRARRPPDRRGLRAHRGGVTMRTTRRFLLTAGPCG